MKNINKIFVSALAVLSLSSCLQKIEPTDYLTEEKKNEIGLNDPDKVYAATLAGIYSEMQQAVATDMSHNYFGQKSFDYLTSLMGNDMIMTGRFGMSLYHYLCDYHGQNYIPTANRWAEYYNHIAAANTIISAINPEDPAVSAAALSYYAQARAARGYAYFYLATLYQRSYYVGCDDTEWGKGDVYDWSEEPCVPLLLESTQGPQPRSSVKDVYAVIIDDLSTAISIFEQIGATKTASPADFDGTVASMYLARTYMNMHEWDLAIAAAQTVIDNYSCLTSEDDILQGFSSLSLPDVVFGCPITSDNSTIYMSWFSQMDMFGDGYAGIGVWRAGFKPFVDRIPATDIRREWFLYDGSLSDVRFASNKSVDYQSCKFIGCGRQNLAFADGKFVGEGWELGNYIYLRAEEAWYIKAEALAHKGDASAVSVLEEVVKTRNASYICKATETAGIINEINFNKRLEFWGEGIEYLDNKRLNIPVDRTDETWPEGNNHYDGCKIYMGAEELGLTYQLPIKEIETNPNITPADQNN